MHNMFNSGRSQGLPQPRGSSRKASQQDQNLPPTPGDKFKNAEYFRDNQGVVKNPMHTSPPPLPPNSFLIPSIPHIKLESQGDKLKLTFYDTDEILKGRSEVFKVIFMDSEPKDEDISISIPCESKTFATYYGYAKENQLKEALSLNDLVKLIQLSDYLGDEGALNYFSQCVTTHLLHSEESDMDTNFLEDILGSPTIIKSLKKNVFYALCLLRFGTDFKHPDCIELNGLSLEHIPESERTRQLCEIAVKQNGLALQFVPEDMKPELYEIAVKQNGLALQFVPDDELKTNAILCLEAVEQNILALRFLPEEINGSDLADYTDFKIRSQELVEENGMYLEHVPDVFKTAKLCKIAVQKNPLALKFVPDDLRTFELCVEAVQKNSNAYVSVPKEQKTLDFYQDTAKVNGMIIEGLNYANISHEMRDFFDRIITRYKYMPEVYNEAAENYKYTLTLNATENLFESAVTNNGLAIQHIPEDWINQNGGSYAYLADAAVRQNPLALEFVTDKWESVHGNLIDLKTPELCEPAVRKNPMALEFVPEELRTQKLCEEAVSLNPLALKFVPIDKKSDKVYELASKQIGLTLEFFPADKKNQKLCKRAVEENPMALEFVPDEYKTPQLCEKAVFLDSLALKFVPNDKKIDLTLEFSPADKENQQLYEQAVQKNPMALEFVPDELKNQELCKKAVQKNPMALEFVLEEFITHELVSNAFSKLEASELITLFDKFELTKDSSKLDIYKFNLSQDGLFLRYIPQKLRNIDLCRIAVNQNKSALDYVPENLRNQLRETTDQYQIDDPSQEMTDKGLLLALQRLKNTN